MRGFLGFLGLCALVACAATPEPDWLTEMRAREAELPGAQTIYSPDRAMRVRVPARAAAPVQRAGEAYVVSLDVGTTASIDCWLYRDSIDFATSVASFSDNTFGAIEAVLGEIEARGVERVDAGAIGPHPYLAVDWIYRVQSEQGPQIGQVKHLVADKQGHGLYCQQNEVGYVRTFRQVTAAILASLEFPESDSPETYFSEVSTMSIRGIRVGVIYTTLSRDGNGDTRIDTRTSLLVPVTADTLQVSDTFEVEFARPDGSLINQVHVETQNGELVSHLELNPQPDGAWGVEGTFQGKPLSTRIESTSRPSSWLGDAMALRRLLAGQGSEGELTTTQWIPDADPTRLLDGTISIQRQIGPERFAAKLDSAGLEADLVVDRAGTIASGSMSVGPAAVDFERVYTDGAF